MHIGLGKLRVEPKRDQSYLSTENILTKIENTFTVKMRKNQGLYNYFMMYETILHHYDKRAEYERKPIDNFVIDIMNETGSVTTKVILKPVSRQNSSDIISAMAVPILLMEATKTMASKPEIAPPLSTESPPR